MGGKGRNNSPGAESLRGRQKAQQCYEYFFITVHLLPKGLKFEHGSAKLASCPWRHLTSLRTWLLSPQGIFGTWRSAKKTD